MSRKEAITYIEAWAQHRLSSLAGMLASYQRPELQLLARKLQLICEVSGYDPTKGEVPRHYWRCRYCGTTNQRGIDGREPTLCQMCHTIL